MTVRNMIVIIHGMVRRGLGGDVGVGGRDAINRVSTIDRTTNDPNFNDASMDIPTPKNAGGITGDKNPMLNDNLSRIIRWYKGRVTFEVRKVTDTFSWQTRFHDRIIRNEEQLTRVRKYIAANPRNWNNDEWYVP